MRKKTAHTKIHTKMLREFLRLPQDVEVLGIRPDPDNAKLFILDIQSDWLPGDGELTAEYSFEHTTHVKFVGWKK